MNAKAPGYMSWAKLHSRAQYELTNSGVPVADLSKIVSPAWCPDLTVSGPYGEPEWMQAIARWRNVDADWILPLPGTSMANFVALATAADRGSKVLIESPAYDPLLRAADFLGLIAQPLHRVEENGYQFDVTQLRNGLADGARAVLVTDLHNPSGLALSPSDQAALIALTAEYNATLIVDEVYLDYRVLNIGGDRTSAAGLANHVMVTDSLTKVYGLGPLRAGWIIAHPDHLARARHVVDLLHVVHPPVSSRLAVEALARLDHLSQECRSLFRSAWPIYQSWLTSQKSLTGCGNDGAIFHWVRLPAGVSAAALCERLFTHYDTNVVPGTFFGCPGHVRIGFAQPPDILSEGLRRVSAALDELRQR